MKIRVVAVALLLASSVRADVPMLLPNETQTRAIAGGVSHPYRLELVPGAFARVEVVQKDIDVAIELSGNAVERQEIDVYPANEGPEVLLALADSAEPLTLTVRALRGHGPSAREGAYSVSIVDVRIANDDDRLRFDAQRSFSRGKERIATGIATGMREAIVELEHAVDLAARAGDTRMQALALLDLAGANQQIRQNSAALHAYEAAIPLLETLGWRRNVGLTLSSIGWIHDGYGDYEASLDYYRRALEILSEEPDSKSGHPTVLASIGLAYASLGDERRALEHYERALAIYRATKNKRGEAVILLSIGQMHATARDLSSALTMFTESQRLQRETSYKRREAQTLTAIARVHGMRGEHAQALPAFHEALAITRRSGDRRLEGVVLDEIAELHLRSGAIEDARTRYAEALEIQRAIRDRRNVALSLYGLARTELAAGRLSEALTAINEALEIVESIRSAELPRDLRVSFRAATADLYETQIEILMSLHALDPEGGWAGRALESSDRARARALTDSLQKVAAKIDGGANAASVVQARALREQIAEKEAVRTHFLMTEGGAGVAQQIDAEIRDLQVRLRDVEGAFERAAPRDADVAGLETLTLEQMTAELGDAALVEYSLGAKRSFVWVRAGDALTVETLPGRATIEEVVGRLQASLTARNRDVDGETLARRNRRIAAADGEAHALLGELYAMLVRPVRDAIGGRALLLVPDGPLALVPFNALHDGVSTLGGAREIVRTPSLSALAALRRAPEHGPAEGTIAILADPVFRPDDARLKRSATTNQAASGRGSLNALPRLRFSRHEATAVGKVVRASDRIMALDFDASRAFLERAAGYRILHFATHALVDGDVPDRSSLVLSLVDRNGTSVDGHIRLHEIYNLDLRSELVVLSACETATGKEMRGEGLMSLTHGFLHAGARRVVSTLWRIDDRATAKLMTHFYRGVLRDGSSPAEALRAAQRELARDKRWAAPYYWAGFVLQGDPG